MNRKDVIRSILASIPMLLIAGMIFFFSSQPAEQSSETSGVVVRIATYIIEEGFDNMSQEIQSELTGVLEVIIRKLAHFTEYAVFAMTIMLFVGTLPITSRCCKMIISAVGGILYAASDEIHQLFVPGRDGHIRDVCIDSAGVLSGIFLFILIVFLIKLIKKDKIIGDYKV